MTGGLTGLLGAGESIAGASVGGAVGSGVGYALGAGPVSQIVSGVAGGLAGRTAIKTARNRPGNRLGGRETNTRNIDGETVPYTQPNESTPLLPRGNRLGGRTGRSRLVDSEISQQTIDPTTDETTQWVLPTEEQRTMLDRVKKAAKRTMSNMSDTVHNIRQQIIGRTKKGGTYAQIPQKEERLQQEDFDEFINRKPTTTANDQLFELIDRRNYGDDELDIENALKNVRKESKENKMRDD
jgi:hypothetical protein